MPGRPWRTPGLLPSSRMVSSSASASAYAWLVLLPDLSHGDAFSKEQLISEHQDRLKKRPERHLMCSG